MKLYLKFVDSFFSSAFSCAFRVNRIYWYLEFLADLGKICGYNKLIIMSVSGYDEILQKVMNHNICIFLSYP